MRGQRRGLFDYRRMLLIAMLGAIPASFQLLGDEPDKATYPQPRVQGGCNLIFAIATFTPERNLSYELSLENLLPTCH